MWKHIRLEASTFHSSKLMKKLLGKANFIYISLFWSTSKVQKFFFQKGKWGKPKLITTFPPFWNVIQLNISIWLFLIADPKAFIIRLTAIVKMCSISYYSWLAFIQKYLFLSCLTYLSARLRTRKFWKPRHGKSS